MARPRHDLDDMLERLDQTMPQLLKHYPDDVAFWPRFAKQADEVCEASGSEDSDWVLRRIDSILQKYGKAGGDYLPPP